MMRWADGTLTICDLNPEWSTQWRLNALELASLGFMCLTASWLAVVDAMFTRRR
jgi:hypothetical protein